MRVTLVAESFLPTINGVSNSVRHAALQLRRTGHQPTVVAPGPGPSVVEGIPVVRVRSVPLPWDREIPVGYPPGGLTDVLRRLRPDVVHLASPTVLGWYGARAALELGVPSVAVYQTDLAGFARRHHMRAAASALLAWQRRVHALSARTLVPSTWTMWQLSAAGFADLALWGRGVDVDRFHPRARSLPLRRQLAPGGELLVGYVGRLAREKRVQLLAPISRLRGVRLVLVGDGPRRAALARAMPTATFLGMQHGAELATSVASLDLMVHPGSDETFCQAVQEALASGVPVLAPARGGPLDLVRHGENGWLWPAGEPGVLRDQVRHLAADRTLLRELADRTRAGVAHRTWAAVGADLVGHYEHVLRPVPVPVPASTPAPVPTPRWAGRVA